MQDKAKILIVDDTPENIQILMETLKSEYRIVAAVNGEKAYTIATTDPYPDLVLLDVMMPGVDGYTVCQWLKKDVRTKDIPVIFITALNDEKDEAHGLELGAVDFITKPFKPTLVKARVRNHLELKRHRDHLSDMVEEKVAEIAEAQVATIFAMSQLAESRDSETGKHLERVQTYCRMLAEAMRKDPGYATRINHEFIQNIYHASPLHDIGKVAIPDAILQKPGKYTPEEMQIMRSHPSHGEKTLRAVAERYPGNDFVTMGMEIAGRHHEQWDGCGYPDGLAGEEIPLSAQITSLADVYDALTSARCYKPPFSHEQTVAMIEESAGRQFSPDIVRIFLTLADRFDEIRQSMVDQDAAIS